MDEHTYAFPQMRQAGSIAVSQGGLTLRDWFAGQALNEVIKLAADDQFDPEFDGETYVQVIARQTYLIADAMLAERNKGK